MWLDSIVQDVAYPESELAVALVEIVAAVGRRAGSGVKSLNQVDAYPVVMLVGFPPVVAVFDLLEAFVAPVVGEAAVDVVVSVVSPVDLQTVAVDAFVAYAQSDALGQTVAADVKIVAAVASASENVAVVVSMLQFSSVLFLLVAVAGAVSGRVLVALEDFGYADAVDGDSLVAVDGTDDD